MVTAVDLVLPDDSTTCGACATWHMKVSTAIDLSCKCEEVYVHQLEEYDNPDCKSSQMYTAMIFTRSMIS